MATTCDFDFLEYVDESSIDPNLLCTICHKPFNDPVCTSCDHTYGRECITRWLNTNTVSSCPTCVKQPLRVKELVQASRPLRNMLDQLRVRCTLCEQTGLQRGNFADHIAKFCPKATVQCPAADIKCTWKGAREALEQHVSACIFEPLRPVLGPLIAENRQLAKQLQRHESEIKRLTTQVAKLSKAEPEAEANDSDNDSVHSNVACASADVRSEREEDSIYIRNLPTTVKFNDVFDYFSKVGSIKYDEQNRKAAVFIFKNPNNTTGFCTAKVVYINKDMAAAAVAEFDHKHVSQWNTRLRVSISQVRRDNRRDFDSNAGPNLPNRRAPSKTATGAPDETGATKQVDKSESATGKGETSNQSAGRRPPHVRPKNKPTN